MARQATMTDYFAEALSGVPVLAILRGLKPASAVATAEQCWRAGIPLVEVSLSGGHAMAGREAVCRRGRELVLTGGAGTVLTADQGAAGGGGGGPKWRRREPPDQEQKG